MQNGFSLASLSNEPNQIDLFINQCSSALNKSAKPIIIFGTGILGLYYLEIINELEKKKEIYFCDNDQTKWGTYIEGVKVISFNELVTDYRDSYIVIASFHHYEDISVQLNSHQLNSFLDSSVHAVLVDSKHTWDVFKDYRNLIIDNLESFSSVYRLLSDPFSKQLFIDRLNYLITASSKYLAPLKCNSPQYFEKGIITLTDDEVFIDGGAFTGDTVEEFLYQCKGSYKKIISFEPEESKHEEFYRITSDLPNVHLLPNGLWNQSTTLSFNAKDDGTSGICSNGSSTINVSAIDDVLEGDEVTFIKMDIEGAELEALRGAEKTIIKHKPKLAICVYHNPLDIVQIPLYLNELVPEYKFYLRHYNTGASETVCYAIAD